MKKYLIIICLLVLSIWYNINSIFSFYYNVIWNQVFLEDNFKSAELSFDKSLDFKTREDVYKKLYYNKANVAYKLWNYQWALDIYKILEDIENDFKIWHNMWNSYYKVWDEISDLNLKIDNWEKSLESYENALSVNYDEETKKNFDFVKEKLEKLKEENWMSEEKKWDKSWEKSWEKKDGEKAWKWEEKQDENWGESWEKWEEKSWEKWEWAQSWEQEEKSSFSEQQKEEIENYMKNLEKNQEKNQNSFNRNDSQRNNPLDNFFNNDPFFNKWAGGGDVERDW